ncbi:hypothetical protein AC579_1845 [Pseudocercospora musae]|uniref:Alcohol dehydrogenase iron-type/glycerol dehydrogenase GldA domain-containing protein n=1 Tax=Pseudocercospora musae TaxID=113226 RepID=A0A139I738_9PEZI|nr:hypothetical protein AC579_1845 [Pseudocercospora musae]
MHVEHGRFAHAFRRSVPHQPTSGIQRRYNSTRVDSSSNPLSGLWKPTHLQRLHYGPDSVKKHLLECLPNECSKAFVLTGTSLANKTSLIKQVEQQLASRHAQTFSKIGQHAPVKELDEATELVMKDETVDTIISVGGGSPIDSAKGMLYAATRSLSCLTRDQPSATASTRRSRATTEIPCRQMALASAGELFANLPAYHKNPKDEQVITKLQLAAFASLGFLALNFKGGLGLSHTLGYALGSPFGIPHGITSCLTLGHVVKLKAESSEEDAAQLARMAPFIGIAKSGDNKEDGIAVGDAILTLVRDIGLKTTLTEKGVSRDKLDWIVKTATRQDNGPVFDKVKQLVEDLY